MSEQDHDPDEVTVDDITGRLLGDPDAGRRYRTVRALEDGALRDVAVISLRQLRAELGSTTAAAEAVGISRQAANELLDKADAPSAREDKGIRTRPGWRYGQLFGLVSDLASVLDHWVEGQDYTMQRLRLEEEVKSRKPPRVIMPKLTTTAQEWVSDLSRWDSGQAEQYAADLDEMYADLAAWVFAVGDRNLNEQEAGDLILGCSVERRAWRQRRQEAAAA